MNAQITIQSTQAEPATLPLTERLAVRLYRDCRPNCLETAQIQKGLILVLDGCELIEEGIGFGVPVAKYSDKTYFSISAEVKKEGNTIEKLYFLDAVSRKRIWRAKYIDDGLYQLLRKTFEKSYHRSKRLTTLFNQIMELRDVVKIRTDFVKVPPRGAIKVKYLCQPSGIRVSVDFADLLLKGCEELLVLNEQGSNFFCNYADSNGSRLVGGKIGAWDRVKAEKATLHNGEVSFVLRNVGGSTLFRGWERTRKRFSWAGLSYSLYPNNGTFTYTIDLYQKCKV